MTGAATEVEFTFSALGPALTRVAVEHRGWEALTEEQLTEACAVPGGYAGGAFTEGWGIILGRLANAVERTPSEQATEISVHTVFWRNVVKYVVFYQSADDVASKAPAHFPAHFARGQEFHAQGTLLMFGTFGNPHEEGAMAVFTTREAAEEFINGDPFVLNGVIRNWYIREWNEVFVQP